jgi:hypothetical protein
MAFIVSGMISCKTRQGGLKSDDVPGTPDPQALTYINKLDNSCGRCHGDDERKLTYETLARYAVQTQAYQQCLDLNACFDELDKAKAATCWNCITGAGELVGGGGLYHTAIESGIVRVIAEKAELNFAEASARMMRMPPRFDPASSLGSNIAEFRTMANWFANEANTRFARIRTVRTPIDPNANPSLQAVTCDQFPQVVDKQIIEDFSMEGTAMFGCRGTQWPDDPNTCHAAVPNSEFGDSSTSGVTVKILRKLKKGGSAFWMRSSPDGRYASIGNGTIEDLKTEERSIAVDADFIDPAFSPDNKFYIWPSMICPLGPLNDLTVSQVGTSIPASGCVSESVGVYGSLATDANGDILLISGYTNNNFGGGGQTTDASEMPGKSGSFSIRRISNNKITDETLTFSTPYETDYQISPTGKIVVGRLLSKDHGQVFRVRTVRPDGVKINPEDLASSGVICMKGEKANVSFDNRFVVFHHYADGSPQDKGQSDGAANVFVYDILKRKGIRVTNFTGRNGAYFPHFRADGWIVFQIKESDGTESIATSNAALVLKDL